MAYNSAYTGSQVDAAVGAVRQKETIWDGKQDELTGTEDQLVGFNSSGEAVAVAKPDPLPAGGETGQVLTKTAEGTAWDDIPSDLPAGGTDGQILTKTADGVAWEDTPDTGVTSFNSRTGAVTPQEGDYTADMVGARPDTWTPSAADVGARPDTWTPSADDVGAMPAVSGGTTGQVLTKTASGQAWQDAPSGGITQTQADARYLQLSGGTMTGYIQCEASDGSSNLIGYSPPSLIPGGISVSASKADGSSHSGITVTGEQVIFVFISDSSGLKLINLAPSGLAMGGLPITNCPSIIAPPTRLTAVLSASGWSGNSQTITVNGVITDTSAQDIDISCADKASADAWAAGGVWCSNPTTVNRLTFTCTTPPTANINLNIRLWEVG